MKQSAKPISWIVAILVALGIAGGAIFYSPYAEHKLAEEAVANVAGGATMTRMVEASWGGRRSTLWCAIIDRPDGLVAVTTRRSRMPLLEKVTEVAPDWVGLRNHKEHRMLEACREVLISGSPAVS